MKKLNILVKASLKSNVLLSCFFSLFVALSAVLVLLSLSIIIPLRSNIDSNIINHVTNREIIDQYSKNAPAELPDEDIAEFKKLDHVVTAYELPSEVSMEDTSGFYTDGVTLGFFYDGSDVELKKGRYFKKSDKNVCIVPELVKEYTDSGIRRIEGEKLIGKLLSLSDEYGKTHKYKVVGAYRQLDPLYTDGEIMIPRIELMKLHNELKAQSDFPNKKENRSVIILVDSIDNVQSVCDKINDTITYVRPYGGIIDPSMYQVALYITQGMLILFLIMITVGFSIFLKNNISVRTSEFALYRAIGYSSKKIFYIVFSEHILLTAVSLVFGVLLTVILNAFVFNPIADSLLGNTIMEMNITTKPICVLLTAFLFTAVLLMICYRTVRRSEKMDLTVLLREQ